MNNTTSSETPMWWNEPCTNMSNCSSNDTMIIPIRGAMSVTINGYIAPLLVVFTIITNTLVCIVLLKKHMQNPTNCMLVAMAISDMLTGVFPVPFYIYLYTFGNYEEYIPAKWCFTYSVMTDTVPTIFHSASIWLTVGLAVQRYIYVCHSLKAKQICTIPNVVKAVVIVYILATVSQLGRFLDTIYIPKTVPSLVDPTENVSACKAEFVPFVNNNTNAYFNVYYWFRIICVHMLPCVSLVIMNSILVETMHTAQKRRKLLLKQHRNTEGRKLKESNGTTLMLVAVVGLFLVVELPSGVLFIIMIVQNTFNFHIMSEDKANITTMMFNLCILLSYPLNFFIYCGMSRQFRETFKRLFVSGSTPMEREHSKYMSLACENGHGRATKTNETNI